MKKKPTSTAYQTLRQERKPCGLGTKEANDFASEILSSRRCRCLSGERRNIHTNSYWWGSFDKRPSGCAVLLSLVPGADGYMHIIGPFFFISLGSFLYELQSFGFGRPISKSNSVVSTSMLVSVTMLIPLLCDAGLNIESCDPALVGLSSCTEFSACERGL